MIRIERHKIQFYHPERIEGSISLMELKNRNLIIL